jgi:hypothetical protein
VTPDIPLLRKHMDWVLEQAQLENNGEWEQRAWAMKIDCGTARCIAGNVVAMDGGEFRFNEVGMTDYAIIDGGPRTIRDYAQKRLGLTNEQASHLFMCDNTVEDIVRIAGEIAEAAGDRL